MSLRISPVPVRDEALLHTWWDCGRRTNADRPSDAWPAWEVSRVALPTPNPEVATTLFAAFDGDDMVGTGMVKRPLEDNQHTAFLEALVPPEHRRRGVGGLLADEAERLADSDGRTTLLADVYTWPGGGQEGLALLAARGYAEANTEQVKVLHLADLDPLRPPLEEAVRARLGDYRIVTWQGAVPEEHLAGYGRLLSGFLAEIPLGDVDLQDSDWTPGRIRASEARDREVGRHEVVAAVLAPRGDMVGFSSLRLSPADPLVADVGLTIVDEGHRGDRLGLGLKLASHAVLREAFPDCARLITCNAASNQHMNAVNEQLGYGVVETIHEFQRKIPQSFRSRT